MSLEPEAERALEDAYQEGFDAGVNSVITRRFVRIDREKLEKLEERYYRGDVNDQPVAWALSAILNCLEK